MRTMSISEEKFNKVISDVEILIEDLTSIFNQDEILRKRLDDIKKDSSIGKSEKELDSYLKKRGIKID